MKNIGTINAYITSFSLNFLIFLQPINRLVDQYELVPYVSLFFRIILLLGQLGIVYSFLISLKKLKKDVLVLFFMLLLSVIFTYLFFQQNMKYFTEFDFTYYFLYSFLGYSIIRQCNVEKKLFNFFLYFFSISTSIFLVYVKRMNVEDVLPYMEFGFALIIPILILIYLFLIEKKKWLLPFIIISVMMLFVYSNRGVILCIASFVFLYLIRKLFITEVTIKKTLISLFTFSLVFSFIINYKNIFQKIILSLDSNGIESRTLKLLIDGNFSDDSGRSYIQYFFLEKLKENPFGYGIYGDRYIYEKSNGIATYPHNLFLELLIDFGIVVGGILIILLVYTIFKKFIINTELSFNYYLLLSVFFSSSIVQLMLSSSYLASIPLWLFLGLLLTKETDFYAEKKLVERKN
ncbi:O-antigen ligase family protein [Vagococcus carniphilus]|uniref:O-antigen ligase family protein n=1 Tax=Vagococcus carniphilus TaxID=218144 RepID=UPI003BACD143